MRDFYPEDMRRRNWLFDLWRNAALKHGFEEYDAPVVETEELLTRKSGEEIVHQIYNFKDKSGRKLALRPEMTPSLARMIIARQSALAFPLKWFSLPQCFRYERTTRGRKREHFQWNLDIVGVHLRLGDRTLLEKLFAATGIPTDHFLAVCLALDKRGKINDEEMADLLKGEGLDQANVERAFQLLAIQSMDEAEALLEDKAPIEPMKELFALMENYGWGDYLTFDLSIIRGLDYYTGIVFEAFDRRGKFRALFGGGRYDNLLSSLGGKTVPSVGLGFGDVVVWELLDDLGLGKLDEGMVDAYVGYMSVEERALAIQGATKLRKVGRTVSLALKPQKPRKFFTAASKAGARFALFVGPGEREKSVLALKDLGTGDQKTVALDKITEVLS
jgi:histidyl-tRNA synthetase